MKRGNFFFLIKLFEYIIIQNVGGDRKIRLKDFGQFQLLN